MNIDNLTFGEIKQITSLLNVRNEDVPMQDPTLGKYCIVRTYSAGVFAGTFKCRIGNKIVLENSRRLWKWKATQGISLSEVSQYGVDVENSRICCVEPIKVIEDIEITPCSDIARETIQGARTYQP